MVNHPSDKRGSLDMINQHEYPELVDSVLNIKSSPNLETRGQLYFPLTEEDTARLRRAASKL